MNTTPPPAPASGPAGKIIGYIDDYTAKLGLAPNLIVMHYTVWKEVFLSARGLHDESIIDPEKLYGGQRIMNGLDVTLSAVQPDVVDVAYIAPGASKQRRFNPQIISYKL